MDAPFAYTLNNNTITFDAGSVPGFTGIAVTQTRGVADHTINSNLAPANNITVRNNSAGALNLNGTTSLGNRVITFDGTGSTRSTGVIAGTGSLIKNESGSLTLNAASTYTGTTTVNAGTLVLGKAAGTNSIVGNLVIGDGSGTDTVRLNASNQIADTAGVQINSSGVLNLNNFFGNHRQVRRFDGCKRYTGHRQPHGRRVG